MGIILILNLFINHKTLNVSTVYNVLVILPEDLSIEMTSPAITRSFVIESIILVPMS